jgi:hypothetical protein
VVRLVHINKCRLSLCCLLSALVEFWEARTIALLRQALISEDTADIFVFNNEPRMASIPELDLGYGLIGSEDSVFLCWLCPAGARERKLWSAYQHTIITRSTQLNILFSPAAVDMGFRAVLEILKTDDFEEFKEAMGLKASILKDMIQSATREMDDGLHKLLLPAIRKSSYTFCSLVHK